jgi:hypothetical protein
MRTLGYGLASFLLLTLFGSAALGQADSGVIGRKAVWVPAKRAQEKIAECKPTGMQCLTSVMRACEIGGYAYVGFDFDGTGNFIGAKLLRLSRARHK